MVLQVGTTSFQSTAGESSRRPVDTFVRPVSVLPKTGIMELAETLQSINPTLQKFVNFTIQKEKQKGILEGQNQILGSTPTEINKIKKELEKKEGKRFARNFVGGNIYTQYGIEKQLAINLGNAAEAKTKKFFSEYQVNINLPNGETIQQPLSQFDVDSPQFDAAVNEFQETNLLDVKGIRPDILNQHFLPRQNLALQKAIGKHTEDRADQKIQLATTTFSNSLLGSWNNIDNINDSIELNVIDDNFVDDGSGLSQAESIALKEIQDNADYMVSIGLSEAVSPASFKNYITSSVNTILQSYKDADMSELEAMEEIDDFIDFIGKVKVGPKGLTKTGQTVQKDLKSFLDADNTIVKLKKEIFEEINSLAKQENDFLEAAKQNDINNRLDQLDFASDDPEVIQNNARIISALKQDYKNEIDFVDTQVTLRNFNVDGWFLNFQKRWVSGEFDGNKLAARTELNNFMISLGSSATKEDKGEYTRLDNLVKSQSGQGLLTQYPEIKGVIKFGEKVLSEEKNGLLFLEGSTVEQKYDLDFKFRQDVEAVAVDSELSSKQKKDKINELIKGYKEQIGNIKNQTYTFFDEDNNISGYKPNETNNNLESNSNETNSMVDAFNLSSLNTSENQRIVSDVVNSLGATDGSLLAMANPTDTETTTIVGSEEPSGVKRFEANFPVFYKLAKDAGHKFPEVTAAQVMLETSNGASPSATNNYLGLKATQDEADKGQATLQNTQENIEGKDVDIQDNFKNFDSLQDMMNQYKTQWNDDFMGRKGTVNVDTAEEAAKLLQANVFATDPDYAKKIMQLITDAKRNPPLF